MVGARRETAGAGAAWVGRMGARGEAYAGGAGMLEEGLASEAGGEGEVKWLLQNVNFGRKALDFDIEYI